jgi:hypothetical protein
MTTPSELTDRGSFGDHRGRRPTRVGRPWVHGAAAAAIAALAVLYVTAVLWQADAGVHSHDIYGAPYPISVYAQRALEQGHGLLWNSLQNCGQPFLPAVSVSAFYPLNSLLYFLDDFDTALTAIAVCHLALGGVAIYLLSLRLGFRPAAALCGAITFELGGTSLQMAGWFPTLILGSYAWLAVAAYCTERLLQLPSISNALVLALALTLQLLLGYPQLMLFTYQILSLRLLCELLSRRSGRAVHTTVLFALALLLPAFLGAAHLFPLIEFAGESIRGRPLSAAEMLRSSQRLNWQSFQQRVAIHPFFLDSFALVPVMLASLATVAVISRRQRARLPTLFYLLLAILSLLIAFEGPISDAYMRLPLSNVFREPTRMLWITDFAFAVVVAAGANVLLSVSHLPGRTRAAVVSLTLGSLGGYALLFSGIDRWFSLALILALGFLFLPSVMRRIAGVLVPGLLAVNLYQVNSFPYLRYTESETCKEASPAFQYVRDHRTAQDRVYQNRQGCRVMEKSASLFGIPSTTDYEPMAPRRYAELFVRMRRGQPLRSINDYYYIPNNVPANMALFHLLAARYVVVDGSAKGPPWPDRPPFELRWQDETLRVFENTAALPRAFFVPRVEVVPEANLLLERLASSSHEPREVALVEEEPADGFLGTQVDANGEVTILEDHDEELTLRVRSSAEGFLSLTDQFYPGWQAFVNDVPAAILRANYAFRAVRVPSGESTVRFVYRPLSVRLGLWVSGVSTFLLLGWAAFTTVGKISSIPTERPFLSPESSDIKIDSDK